ncbi:hypothetical protein [Burkholderia cenocepacia]|uniref:hypothetical protein n=1 Tax=Burkholderia cenocepacia TaxID=95486 RepID=UPI001CF1B3E5|nr:hypothetical protein [Burkholderia cenocepacia]MCA8004330.1 hypothetical protein [Burkholderia cenocepacia]
MDSSDDIVGGTIGCLRANGLAARPRDEGAHFTGSRGEGRQKWLKRRERWKRREAARRRRARRADACATARRRHRTRPVRDDMRLKRSARMLHERGAGGGARERACAADADARPRRAAAIRQSRPLQVSGYPAPKPSRAQQSFRDAGATVVSV